MDSELCQINRLYLMQLSGYNKVVLQRNKLLKDLSFFGTACGIPWISGISR